jgi:DNA topoisomerase-1
MSVIEDRGYVERRGQALVPSWLAFAVVRLLEDHFGDLVDYDFTAEMESSLDRIAEGAEDREGWLRSFYYGRGDGRMAASAERDPGHGLAVLGLKGMVEDQGDIDARAINTIELGGGIELRVGRYGPYIEAPALSGDGPARRASVPSDLAPDELTHARAEELLAEAAKGVETRTLGIDPATGRTVVARVGRFGPYVTEAIADDAGTSAGQEGAASDTKAAKGRKKSEPAARNASLLKSMSIDTVTLDEAIALLSLPRVVGTDPATGEAITAQNGRYGPYLRKGTDSRSLGSEEQIFTVTLDEALAVFAAPRTRRGGGGAAASKELGADPASGKPILLKAGRYGPYVTDGETNATLPRGEEPDGITLERAAELLADKRARGPVARRGGGRRTAGGAKGAGATKKAGAVKGGAATKKAGTAKGAGAAKETGTRAEKPS